MARQECNADKMVGSVTIVSFPEPICDLDFNHLRGSAGGACFFPSSRPHVIL
jgi:hypothetical protein